MTNKINKCDGNHGGPRCADPECWNDDPVPPAGGDVEVLGYSVKGNRYAIRLTKAELLELYEGYAGDALIELVDRAHITRLQAEVERLKAEHRTENQALRSNFARHSLYLQIAEQLLEDPAYERSGMDWDYEHPVHDGIIALQAELTKAREGADKWKLAHRLATEDNFKLTKARELLARVKETWRVPDPDDDDLACWDSIDEFLTNQSAPADKDEECVHDFRMFSGECHKCGADWIPGKEYSPADKGHGGPVAWANWKVGTKSYVPYRTEEAASRSVEYSELAATQLGPYQVVPLYAEQPAPVAVVPEKYDDVLLPFLSLMRAELHANARKGDRPGWLRMDRKTAVLEVFYHMGKLHQAVHRDEAEAIKEYAADVANMCMMLVDVCGCINSEPKP